LLIRQNRGYILLIKQRQGHLTTTEKYCMVEGDNLELLVEKVMELVREVYL